jgi:hypothetical protein
MSEFVADLIPASVRGRELGRTLSSPGAVAVAAVIYEHLTIAETLGTENSAHDVITVTFVGNRCQ